MTVVIGVTGGICSGKSSVAKILRDKGYPVVDADQLGHRTYVTGTECFHKLVQNFGDQIVGEDGAINRRVLGGIVFSDKAKMEELNGIVWPEIRKLIIEELDRLRAEGHSFVVLEAAVMIEAKWYDLVDEVWVVYVDEAIAIDRLMKRNNLSEEQARQRISSQLGTEERLKYASKSIRNENLSLEPLIASVEELLGERR